MSRVRLGRWLLVIPMGLLAVATIYLLLFTANVAMKTRREYILDRFSLADSLRFENITTAWTSVGMGRYTANSILVVGCSVFLLLLFGSMAGFALSQLRFRGSTALFIGCLAALFIPFQVIMVPLARVMADSGLVDTYPGLILAYVAQFLPFTVFLMTSYYRTIPAEIIDAARIDGNTVYGVYRRIMLPLGAPALLSVGILNTLFCWNDVLISLLLMPSADHRTLMVGVTSLRGSTPRTFPPSPPGCSSRRSPSWRSTCSFSARSPTASPLVPRKADMRITGYRTLTTVQEWGRPVGDANGVFPDGVTTVPITIVETDAGISGVGLGPHVEIEKIFPAIEGEDPRAVTSLYDRMLRHTFKAGHGGLVFGTIGALDTALWDIKAQLAGEPLWRLLGGRDRRVPAYASGIDIGLTDDELVAEYEVYAGYGLRAAKLKGGLDIERDRHRLTLVREVLTEAATAGGPV